MYSRWTFVLHRKVSFLCLVFPLVQKWESTRSPAQVVRSYNFWKWSVSFCHLLQGWMKHRSHLQSQPKVSLSSLLHLQLHVASNITQALSFITLSLHFSLQGKTNLYETKKMQPILPVLEIRTVTRQNQLDIFKHQRLWPFLWPLRETSMQKSFKRQL